MNDPGLDEPISNDAKDVENQIGDEQKEKEENEDAFLEPSRWWFASTAFPLIAGTLGPMASAFSICALAVPWRVYFPPGSAEENGIPLPDPKWLVGINGAQLAIALISNFSLLLNMARRVRSAIAQPITIIGWYLSSFFLIGLTACASGPLVIEPKSDHAFTQGYYYAVFAAALYFLVASLMVVNVWGALKGHYEMEFQLTMSQRTLMLQTISFLVYLLLGALVFSHIEGWLFLDALYWADYTLLTVGIGDYAPTTHLGRGLLFPFGIGGIIILGLVIGSVRTLVLERGKEKMGARMLERERRRFLQKLEKDKGTTIVEPVTEKTLTMSRTLTSLGSTSRVSTEEVAHAERERRRQEFHLMRKIQDQAATRRRWTSLVISGSTWFVLWFVGAAVFQAAEYGQDWTYFASVYFSYTSLLTIGYGDLYPQSNSGKAFFVVWSLLAVPSLTILISNMGDTIVKGIRDLTLWVGNLTVLPGEKGVIATLKESAHQATRGRIFSNAITDTPAGLLGETNERVKEDGSGGNKEKSKNDPESAAQRVAGDKAAKETRRAEEHGKENDKLPSSRRHYHSILIKEISKVTKHLNSSPPRKYTFDEWAWFLKLIGEDESFSQMHRQPLLRPKGSPEDRKVAETDGEEHVKWSWLGHRSPLMEHREEPDWVLEMLTRVLDKELEEMRKEEEQGKENGTGGGKWPPRYDQTMDEAPRPESNRTFTKGSGKSNT